MHAAQVMASTASGDTAVLFYRALAEHHPAVTLDALPAPLIRCLSDSAEATPTPGPPGDVAAQDAVVRCRAVGEWGGG